MKEFDITTTDIQWLILSLISAEAYGSDGVIPDEWFAKAKDQLIKINRMCKMPNNYTLTITVKEKENKHE